MSNKSANGRGKTFNTNWIIDFGLQITARDTQTGAICSAKCRFCENGRDADVNDDGGRKRKRTERTKYYQTGSFRKDNIVRHLKQQHSKRWSEYQAKSRDEKVAYFDSSASAARPMDRLMISDPGLVQCSNMSKVDVAIDVRKEIVDVILEEMLQVDVDSVDVHDDEEVDSVDVHDDEEEDDDTAESVSRTIHVCRASEQFQLVGEEGQEKRYQAIWSNKLQLELIVSYVSIGISFRQASSLLLQTKEKTGLGYIGCTDVGKIIRAVRYVCALNFETMSNVLDAVWAFSIAVDGGTKSSVPYLDIRARFCIGPRLFNVHVVALPMYESHSGENMANAIAKFFHSLCPQWKSKLISVSTDGASSMTGRHQGVVTRLDEFCINEHGNGIFRIWCGAHQLDLVIQGIYTKMLNESFIQRIHQVTGYLRRQQNLVREMGTTCPKFVSTRWLSMVRLLKWLKKHRLRVCRYMDEKNPGCKPDLSWWVMVYLLYDFANTVSLACKSLQGLTTLMSHQDQVLGELANRLRQDGCVKGPVMNIAPVENDNDTYVNQVYYSRTVDAEQVVGNCQLFVRESMGNIRAEAPDKYNEIIASIRELYVDAVTGIKGIIVERDTSNRGTSELPPVLPKGLLHLTGGAFGDLVTGQRLRIANKLSEEEIICLEDEFKAFKDQTYSEPGFRQQIEAMADSISFDDAWKPISARYPLLCMLCGGLATVFPGTSTVESDFSVIGFEKDEYRQSMTNLSLEGILQCKQFTVLEEMQSLLQG
jgi:hypothetical protein